MTLETGRRLGPYEIVASLGAGGMGEVYEAKDTRLGRTVAIKVLPEGLAENPERKARFEREARTISQLSHPRALRGGDAVPETRARPDGPLPGGGLSSPPGRER